MIGVASGPLQDNTVDTSNKEGGTELCDGCAQFTIQHPAKPDECQSCTPGFYYTNYVVRCEGCEPGYARAAERTLGPDDEYNVSPFTDPQYDVGQSWPAVGPESFRCTPCAPGKYQSESEQTNCVLCPAGKYGDSWFNTGCKDCPMGQYMNTQGHYIANGR